jgi:exonuclease SbcC
VKTSQDLFKQLDEAESLFSKGSIKIAQKKVREVISKSKELDKIPNKLRHKINFAIGQSRYFDDMSSFATNPKREELIKEISTIIESPLESPKKQAHLIHDVQTKWQLLDLSSRPASKEQWNKFNELTNKAWEPCSEYFDELKQIKINNAAQRMEIVNDINKYVEDNSSNWPQPKFLIQFLRQSFDEWQKYAPVLDKDLNKLRNAYFEAKKPINDAIKKQEQIVIKAKEALIEKVNAITDEDNDICIKKFNDLKNEWKKAGSAGRKADNKLWDKFNKSADRFFNAKKEVIDAELIKANELLSQLKSDEISISEVLKSLSDLKNISKTKEFNAIQKQINSKRKEQELKLKQNKIDSYTNLLDAFLNNELDNTQVPSSIKNKLNEKPQEKSSTEALTYACVKLEALAGIDSLKKDAQLRQSIQMEMLTNKFNKVSNNLNSVDDLLIHFVNNISAKPTAAEKTLWKRVSKAIEILV